MSAKNCIPGQPTGAQPSAQWVAGPQILSATVSSTNVYTSATQAVANKDNCGLQISFTGTMAGTLTVKCSIDNVNFDALTFSPVLTQPSGSNLRYLINLNQLPFPYFQVVYTNASGSGTLAVYFSAKDLN